MKTTIARRKFFHNFAVGAAGAMAFPYIARAAGSTGKLNVACVGIGHQGYKAIMAAKKENLVAICDVDLRNQPGIFDDDEPSPAETFASSSKIAQFTDFRRMLDKMHKEIDVVLVSTPDHTHFPIAMAAMEYGIPVFLQKPLAHNIWQVRTLRKAMHRYGVKTVMGNQGHTSEGIRLIKEWYEAGVLGEVREVHCWTDRPRLPWFVKPDSIPPKKERVPKNIDWDLWQGPTKTRSFSNEFIPKRWRGWWDYGVGCLGDIGCHSLDAPFWALDLGIPTAVEVKLEEPANRHYTPFAAHVTFHFPTCGEKPPVILHWYEGRARPPKLDGMKDLPADGMYMIGSKEILYNEGIFPESPQLWPRARMANYRDVLRKRPLARVGGGPFQELFSWIKNEGPKTGSNFDYASQLTEVVLLGAMAIRSGRNLKWDVENMVVQNAPELSEWVKEPVRKGWSYGENLWI